MRWATLIGTVGVVATLVAAAPVQAGTYTVYGCKKPDGTPAPADGWGVYGANTPAVASADACASGGSVQVALSGGTGHGETGYVDFGVAAPAGLPIVGYTLYRLAQVQGPSTGPAYTYDLLENGSASPESCLGACSRGDGDSRRYLSESSAWSRAGRFGELRVRLTCRDDGDPNTAGCPNYGPPGAQVLIHRAELTLEDTTDPEFSSPPSGTLFDTGRELSGVVSASFSARDSGSGVFRAVVEVDGRTAAAAVVDDNDRRCELPFVHRVPCKASAAGTISLDTAALEDGEHNVRLLVQDATRENQIAYGPVTIRTRNRAPGRGDPNGTNAGDGARLVARWRGRRTDDLRSRYNRRVAVVGTLKDAIGRPIVGGVVEIVGRDLRVGARGRVLARATTAADGSWGHRLRARPSMAITVRYRAFSNDPRPAAEDRVTLRVRAAATLRMPRTARRGRLLRATGRVLGGPIPRGGKQVILQVFDAGAWRVADETKTDRRGRFRAGVRVRRSGGRRVFRFRLLIRREAAYPYSLGTSPQRRVVVLP